MGGSGKVFTLFLSDPAHGPLEVLPRPSGEQLSQQDGPRLCKVQLG